MDLEERRGSDGEQRREERGETVVNMYCRGEESMFNKKKKQKCTF